LAKQKPKEQTAPEPSFEQAIEQLEGIVHQLEEGEIGLDEALARYEKGVRLLRRCYELLETAEQRIELLSGVDADGNPVSTPFDDTSGSANEKPTSRGGPPSGSNPPHKRGTRRRGERHGRN